MKFTLLSKNYFLIYLYIFSCVRDIYSANVKYHMFAEKTSSLITVQAPMNRTESLARLGKFKSLQLQMLEIQNKNRMCWNYLASVRRDNVSGQRPLSDAA